jgi:cobalt transport protein ATP-binding subunit
MSGASTLAACGVSFTYLSGDRGLVDVTLDIQEGEVVGLLAPNGSGKTTLLKALVGLLEPQSGIVCLNGKPLCQFSQAERCRNIGLVMQNPDDQILGATVEEDVGYGPTNLGLAEAEIRDAVLGALSAVGAEHTLRRPTHELSFGEKKRVAIAGILAMAPPVLLFDEPTSGLDPVGEEGLWVTLQRISRERRTTVLVATHAIDLAPRFVERVALMRDGRILRQGATQHVLRDVEALEACGLRLPHIAQLMSRLKNADNVPINGLPLTVENARTALLPLLKRRCTTKGWRVNEAF